MKRPLEEHQTVVIDNKSKKKMKTDEQGGCEQATVFTNLGEDLLFEVLKHADPKTLASAACVSKQWSKTAQDERLWEMIYTRHWASKTFNSNPKKLRSMVLNMGGFRRIYSQSLWPLLKPFYSSPSSSLSPAPKMPTHWGKDEVHLSLSLLSIRYFQNMNPIIKRPN
ncbi:hypothetical protein IFM89_029200 [Coptis chinensis]|uniref:F-box protein GID2 n=1 Tax=Coptis chinensis TaxID=261450 RepID=A0A835IN13_9MAGN|nr:hypothetical protein IFM89_029200 [Coptis chinensis]